MKHQDNTPILKGTAGIHETQETAAIQITSPYHSASIPDTALLVDALNAGSIDAFAPRLAPTVTTVSTDTKQVISGRDRTLSYFNSRLDTLNRCDPHSYLAVAGLFDADGGETHPCAILYDSFQKSCVLRLGVNGQDLVERIMVSAATSALSRARPLEPPAFPQTPILSTLATRS